jgi:hypothetical protein
MTMTTAAARPQSHDDYQPMISAVHSHFGATTTAGPLFTTDATDLWVLFLDALPATERQQHSCHACRRFVEQFGGLVTIDEQGRTHPAVIGEAPGIYARSFAAVRDRVAASRVTGVCLSPLKEWGLASNRDRKRETRWFHMAVTPPVGLVYRDRGIKNAEQAMAEKREEYGMLCRALAEFNADTVKQALAIVNAEALYRGEAVAGPLKWLAALHAARADLHGRHRDNITWRAVATAPAGFCHVRSSMTGTLLEDLAAGLDFDTVKRKFSDKMHPLQYRRPTAAPSDGAIAHAEKIVSALSSAGALRRRFARLDEVSALWSPRPAEERPAAGGVFGHLRQTEKRGADLVIKAPATTWDKFQRTVLPDAVSMEVSVPMRGNFIALVTAADPEAPPIIQWDTEEHRNPVTWYLYSGGSPASQWGLAGGSRAKVNAVSLFPFAWPGMKDHGNHGAGAIFIIDGAKDSRNGGAGLFPELLKSDYHAVSKVIEAYSNRAALEGREEASACGLDFRKGGNASVTVRVTTPAAVTDYTIDRWD